MFNFTYHDRKSIRYKNYDYSQAGAYFITIPTQGGENLFGRINKGVMFLSYIGKIVESEWLKLFKRFVNIKLDAYVVMPNHFHAILIIENNSVGAPLVGAHSNYVVNVHLNNNVGKRASTRLAPTLGDIVGTFKSLVLNECVYAVKIGKILSFEKRIWQRNYYERIVRDEKELNRIYKYIINNPKNWKE